eukprot:768303-Hanusia_phi.AAC.7
MSEARQSENTSPGSWFHRKGVITCPVKMSNSSSSSLLPSLPHSLLLSPSFQVSPLPPPPLFSLGSPPAPLLLSLLFLPDPANSDDLLMRGFTSLDLLHLQLQSAPPSLCHLYSPSLGPLRSPTTRPSPQQETKTFQDPTQDVNKTCTKPRRQRMTRKKAGRRRGRGGDGGGGRDERGRQGWRGGVGAGAGGTHADNDCPAPWLPSRDADGGHGISVPLRASVRRLRVQRTFTSGRESYPAAPLVFLSSCRSSQLRILTELQHAPAIDAAPEEGED